MPSISFPGSPINYQHLPLEIKEKIVHEAITNVLTSSDASPPGSQQVSSAANKLSPKETIRNQSNRLFTLMNVNTEFMKLMLNDLRRYPDPKFRQSLNIVALNSILRKVNPNAFKDLMRNMLKSATHIDLSHRAVALVLSSERLAFIVDQLATMPADHLQTAILHVKNNNEWDHLKLKIAQIRQVNPHLSIHVSFPDKSMAETQMPPQDLSSVLSENENIKGLNVSRVYHAFGEDHAQFFSFLPTSSINELTLQRASTEDLRGLCTVLLAPGCKLNTLNLGKVRDNFWQEDFTQLTNALENPASPVRKLQLQGPWGRNDAERFLNVAGNDNSPLKELDFSGISNGRTFVRAIENQVRPLTERGIKITLPD